MTIVITIPAAPPDWKEIAFESQHNAFHCLIGKQAIRKSNVDSGEIRNVIVDDAGNTVPRWSKDSMHRYFGRKE